jgi:hypothetical protein
VVAISILLFGCMGLTNIHKNTYISLKVLYLITLKWYLYKLPKDFQQFQIKYAIHGLMLNLEAKKVLK